MRLLNTKTRANEVQSTTTNANKVDKLKIKGILCCKADEYGQMKFLSTRTNAMKLISIRSRANDVAKHKNNGK